MAAKKIDLFCHIIPVLSSVYTSLEWGRPAGGIYSSSSVFGTLDRLPIHKEGDGVLGLRHAVVRVARCDTRGGAGNYASRDSKVLEDPAADVDVMGREVITLYDGHVSSPTRRAVAVRSPME